MNGAHPISTVFFPKKSADPGSVHPPLSLPSFQTVQPPGHSRHSRESLGESPVSTFLRAMDQAECDALLDVHGNEALPFNFLAGSEGMPVWGRRLEALHGGERSSFLSLDSRFSLYGRSA